MLYMRGVGFDNLDKLLMAMVIKNNAQFTHFESGASHTNAQNHSRTTNFPFIFFNS